METHQNNGSTAVLERSSSAVAEQTSCSFDRTPDLGSPDPQLPDLGVPILNSTDPNKANTDTHDHTFPHPDLPGDLGFLNPDPHDSTRNLVSPNPICLNLDNKDLISIDSVSPDFSSCYLTLPTQSLSVISEKQVLHLSGSATRTLLAEPSGTDKVLPSASLAEESAPGLLHTSGDSHHVATADPGSLEQMLQRAINKISSLKNTLKEKEEELNRLTHYQEQLCTQNERLRRQVVETVKQATDDQGSLEVKLRKATDKISSLENTLKEKEEEVKHLTDNQEQLCTENERLRQKVLEAEKQSKRTAMDRFAEWFSPVLGVTDIGCKSGSSRDTLPQPITADQFPTSSTNSWLRGSRTSDRTREEGPSSLPHGVPNLGNTCYMAAVLQCLYHMYEFRHYFTRGSYRENVAEKSKENRSLVEAVASMFRALESKSHDIATICREFKAVLESYDTQFLGSRQQEAHDFLSVVLIGLHDSLLNVEDPARHLRGSLVSQLFQGVQESIITCSKKSVQLCATKEPFFSLSLSVSGNSSLEDLLKQHFQERPLEWDCDACRGTSHVCQHSVRVRCLPVYLIIHLSRYTEDSQLGQKSLVSYQDTLTLPCYPDPHTKKIISYHLMAVCQHQGSATQGHYVASCRKYDKKEWYLHEDSKVTYQGSQHRPTHNAHILFYKAKTEETEKVNIG